MSSRSLRYSVRFGDSLRGKWLRRVEPLPPSPRPRRDSYADVTDKDCRGSRVGCFVIDACGTPATTVGITSARERQRSFRSTARLGAGPTTAAVSVHHT